MKVIFIHCVESNFDFNKSFFNTARKGLINRLKIHGMSKFRAKLVGIMRRDGTSIGVVVFDTMEVIMSMMEDERIVCNPNIAKVKISGMERQMRPLFMVKFTRVIYGTQLE
jgi:hypothetical protein